MRSVQLINLPTKPFAKSFGVPFEMELPAKARILRLVAHMQETAIATPGRPPFEIVWQVRVDLEEEEGNGTLPRRKFVLVAQGKEVPKKAQHRGTFMGATPLGEFSVDLWEYPMKTIEVA